MSRPLSLAATALLIALAGCGGSGKSASSATGNGTQAARTLHAYRAARAERMEADLRRYTILTRAGKDTARTCPFNRPTELPTQRLVAMTLADAIPLAEKSDCGIRVTRRDGKNLTTTADLNLTRIDVAVQDGSISRIVGVG